MRRREFIALLGGAVAWPLAADAQHPRKIPTIGILAYGQPSSAQFLAFRRGLRDLGWIEGENIHLEWREAHQQSDRLPALAAELVQLNVDVIFAPSSINVEACRQATNRIPIVFATHADPVGVGHVASLARPGGNITGMVMLLSELVAKQLELLKEAIGGASLFGVLWDPATPSHRSALQTIEAAAKKLDVSVQLVPVQTEAEIDAAISSLTRSNAQAFLDVASNFTYAQRQRLADSALRHRLPGLFGYRQSVEAGGLMSYGADLNDLNRRAAVYVDKILKGTRPADLPVEQASQYALVINAKTAKALGLTIPPSLLARADEMIE